jgi:glycerophosphoryl diester phosphodiesterase
MVLTTLNMLNHFLITAKQKKTVELCLIASFILPLLLNSCNLNSPMDETKSHIKIIGHRGGGGQSLPENSMAAIKFGVEHDCDFIEIDVQQTADSVIVVNHDKTINRTTNGKGYIKNLTFDYLQQFTIKSEAGHSDLNEKIPSLEQLIIFINGKSRLIIEIKSGSEYYPDIEKRVLEIIHRNRAEGWCIIQSFSTDILRKVHSINPKIELHKVCLGKLPIIPVWITNKIEFRRVEKIDFIHGIAVYYKFIGRNLIKTVHESNKQINAWTVDNKNAADRLIKMGVDGIITNYPDLISIN